MGIGRLFDKAERILISEYSYIPLLDTAKEVDSFYLFILIFVA
jgi:hypothetical protein